MYEQCYTYLWKVLDLGELQCCLLELRKLYTRAVVVLTGKHKKTQTDFTSASVAGFAVTVFCQLLLSLTVLVYPFLQQRVVHAVPTMGEVLQSAQRVIGAGVMKNPLDYHEVSDYSDCQDDNTVQPVADLLTLMCFCRFDVATCGIPASAIVTSVNFSRRVLVRWCRRTGWSLYSSSCSPRTCGRLR